MHKPDVWTALIASTVVGGVLITTGAWLIVDRGVEDALERNATLSASEWANYLTARVPDLARLAETGRPSAEQRRFIETAEHAGNVFRWKLFDVDGEMTFDSHFTEELAAGLPIPDHVLEEEEEQSEAQGAWPHVYAEEGDGRAWPLYYAEAFDELTVGGERIGFLEAYVDQTAQSRALHDTFSSSALKLLLLTAFGFVIPMMAFIRQSARKAAADAALARAARHDPLTKLLNRFEFRNRIEQSIAAHPSRSFFVHFLDLDKFKDVNDTRGHAVGDELLRQVALRLEEAAGVESHVCRLGGDEFAFACEDSHSVEDAVELARRTIKILSEPYTIGGSEIVIGASAGIAEYPADGESTTELLRAADLALYEAKGRGRGNFCVFEPAMEEARTRRLALEQRLRSAVENEDFGLCYQPLYKLSGQELIGFEALLRLKDDAGQPVPPSDFIPIAEETGLIVPLGKLVLDRACRAAAKWPEKLGLAVNLSPGQFEEGGLVAAVRHALESSGLEPWRLELEVTERTLMSEMDVVAMQLDRLKEIGVSIALDDFGTGYSSLSYIWKFPFDKLKIDRSFVSKLAEGDERSLQVLKTVVALGEVLGLGITAEGVETHGQASEIARLNVHFVQGFFYGRPMEPDVVTASLGGGGLSIAGAEQRANGTSGPASAI